MMAQCPFQLALPQQMQHRIGRAVGVIGRILRGHAIEDVIRVKARQLIDTDVAESIQQRFRQRQQFEIVVEIGDASGQDQQRGGNRRLLVQPTAFGGQLMQAIFQLAGLGDGVADRATAKLAPGEGADVVRDDEALEPLARGPQNAGFDGGLSLCRLFARLSIGSQHNSIDSISVSNTKELSMPRKTPRIVFPESHGEPALALPAIGQGTWYMGEGLVPRRQEVDALRQGLDLGLGLIDTAEMYGDGGAEEVVGEAIRGRRDDAFVVSKVYPWNAGRDSAIAACERSLKRLGIDSLDLYLLHWPGSIPLDETFEAFERLREAGKIRRFGVSNFDADDLAAMAALPAAGDCATDQVLYHLGSRGIEVDVMPWLRQRRLPLMAYCPLAQGGRLRARLLSSPVVGDIADKHGVSAAQVLLAWVIRPQGDDSEASREVIAIPKAASPEHVAANAAALDLDLDDEDLARLDDAFPAPREPVPLDIV